MVPVSWLLIQYCDSVSNVKYVHFDRNLKNCSKYLVGDRELKFKYYILKNENINIIY